jgi:segregation and condensation protein B
MSDLKSKIEAILFCMPDGVSIRRLSSICGVGASGKVKKIINEIKADYEKRDAGIKLIEINGNWKFQVRDTHLGLVEDAAEPEMPKAVLETLGYIAWKKEILQSTLVKARSTKSYEHIKYLEECGLIDAEPHKNTRKLRPSKKFYKYFNLKEGEPLDLDALEQQG